MIAVLLFSRQCAERMGLQVLRHAKKRLDISSRYPNRASQGLLPPRFTPCPLSSAATLAAIAHLSNRNYFAHNLEQRSANGSIAPTTDAAHRLLALGGESPLAPFAAILLG